MKHILFFITGFLWVESLVFAVLGYLVLTGKDKTRPRGKRT